MSSFFNVSYRSFAAPKWLIAIVLIAASSIAVSAQTTFGRISGSVTDATGAVVPAATVTITDPSRNFTRTATTDDSGFYTVTNIPVGTYTVTVEMANFKKAVRTENTINADSRLTVDVVLEAGQITEVVEVTQTSGETVNITSGEVGKVIDNQQVENLALNGRNYYQLLSLVPGAVLTQEDALDTNLNTANTTINGNRGVTNNLMVDGGNNNNAGSNASQINNVGADFIQEVKLQTSNFSAEYGRSSGAQINVTTKRGTNKFHGSAFEFLRNDAMDARKFFAPVRPFLRYNNYGYSIGGPMPFFNFGENDGPMFKSGKDKFYFFWGQEWKSIHRQAATVTRTLPTQDELNGNFRFRLRGADGIVGTADDGVLRDPNISGTCTTANRTACFGGNNPATWNIIPANRITPDGLAFANVYRKMIDISSSFTNFPGGSNTTFQPNSPADFRQEIIRLDYVFNAKHTAYGRYIHDQNENIDPFGTFTISQLPTIQHARNRPGNGLQFGHIWNIKSNLINDVRANYAWSDQIIPPANDLWARSTYGFQFNQLFANGGTYEASIPDITVSGGYAPWAGAAQSLTALAHDSLYSDTLTWVKGNHTVKAGFQYDFSKVQQNGRSRYAGNIDFNTSRANSTTQVIADMLLGQFRTYTEFEYDPVGKFRFQQHEAFIADSWKVNNKLSLELGVRWQYGLPWYTRGNNITNFDPALYDPAKAVTINGNVVVVGPGANRFNGLIRAGDGVVQSDISYIPSWNSANVNAVPAGAPRGFYDPEHVFMPRVGFAYSPFKNNRTAIRGGFGMYSDRIEGNIIFPLISNPPFVASSSYENGNLSNITGGAASALAPFAGFAAISPNLKTPRTMNFSLGVQHELPGGIFVEANAVGNLGRFLTRNPNINSIPFGLADTPANRPYKGFTNINQRRSDSNSYYYAGQFYAAKRKGQLLATVSYTWSKALTDASGFGDDQENAFDRSFNYGPASFDRRHVFVATYTFAPRFRKGNAFVRGMLDGFEISGITRFQSGRFFTIQGNAAVGGLRRADIREGVDIYLKDDRQWLNNVTSTAPDYCPTQANPNPTLLIKGAFAVSPCNRRGTSAAQNVEGPSLMTWDISARKRIRLGEKMSLRLQADLFNAFNHANFTTMSTNVTAADFGLLTDSGPGRSIQLGAKFQF